MHREHAEPDDAFPERAQAFLSFVVAHAENPMLTVWGAYRSFDVYGLAALAIGTDDVARRLLHETLDMIDQNFSEERANPTKKWHLADFAMHPLLRAHLLFRETRLPGDPVWDRIAQTAQGFLFHYGDLSENHNFLHLTLRYLIGQMWPDAVFVDGRTGEEHRSDATPDILQWMRTWISEGSAEWGADIYYNVNLLSLLNLFDFATDETMKRAAQATLDLMALDEALDAFAGSSVGAARRSYSVYRMDVRQSPARPLHYLWFAPPVAPEPFNLHFLGGVIQAATSTYRPPSPIVWIANDRQPMENQATHLPGVWVGSSTDHLAKHTLRLPEVMQSVMQSPGGGGRYTEHVWQVTMGEEALVFANQPTLVTPVHEDQNTQPLDVIQAIHATPRPTVAPDGGAWYWTYANVPPGHAGDVRPGYWQGNGTGPRSFGIGSLAFLVFNIPPDKLLPWAHVFLPRYAFDVVQETAEWFFLRKGEGYAALWLPGGYTPTTEGYWADTEIRLHGSRCAVLSLIGRAETDGSFEAFRARAHSMNPTWDETTLTLSARPIDGGERITVSYEYGPSKGGRTIDTRGARFTTPWGTLPLGSTTLRLETPVGTYTLEDVL